MQLLPWMSILVLVIASDAEHTIEKRGSSNQKKVVCYYTNWSVYRPGTAKFSPLNINPYLCTHLIYAFGGLDKENGLRPYDKYQDIEQGGYAKFNGLKTYNKNLKTLLAIGGWNEGSARFSKLVDDESKRKEFVKNVIKFLRQNNFDGLDLDWEYPSFRDGSKPSDKENYASLVKELREDFNRESSKTGRPRLLLTMAVPAGIEYIDKGYDVPELNKHLDFMNLLTYDYHSSFEPAVNHHSPLYPLEEDSEYNFDSKLNIDHTIKHYIASGADKEKLVLGIPTYGRSYTLFNKDSTDIGAPSDGPGEKGEATREKGYLAYYEICGNIKKDDTWTIEQPKPRAMGPYAYKDNQWVGYDDEEFVKLKAKYAIENDLGGIMFWSIDNDDFRGNCHSRAYPLIEAGKEVLFGDSKIESSQGKETKVPSKSRPKPRPISRTTTSAPREDSTQTTTTPEPPTTPDTGTDFTCKDEGFFPHPRECKKYFWCLDSGPSNLGIVAHQFTCPSGLVFNKQSDSCDYSRNVACKDKKTPTETTTTTTTTPKPIKSGIKTTTTTTTTTQIPELEEDVEDEFEEEEDPKEIKQLITLIKKLGGVAELEKQLNIKDGSPEVTTPAISKSLYNKVLKIPSNRFQSSYINGPGPQSEGLDNTSDNIDYKKDKPQYVTIRRQRPSKDVGENNKEQEEETPTFSTTERFKPTYKTVDRSRYRDLGEVADENSESDSLPKYTTISRTRSTESDPEETSSPKYVTLHRQRPTYKEDEISDEESTPVSSTVSTSQAPRYVSLLRQRSTTTTTTPEDTSIETTMRDNFEEPRPNTNTKIHRERNRQRITRPAKRTTTTTTTEDSSPISSTESYSQQAANRRRKFRPEYTTTPVSSYEEELTTPKTRNPERRFRSRTTVLKNAITTSTTPETLEQNDRKFFSSSSQPYFDDDSSLFAKTRDDRKISGSENDLANTAVVAIHTLATAPPSNYDFRSSTQSIFRQTTQKEGYFDPRASHTKGSGEAFEAAEEPATRQPTLTQQLISRPLAPESQSPSIKLPVSFQPAPYQPSPFQSGPFQPVSYPDLPFQTNVAFAPIAARQPSTVQTTAVPVATSRQTFLLRRGPPRTTPLAIPTAVSTVRTPPSLSPPPQYLNDNAQEQYADYSEPQLASDTGSEQQVALKGKVRIHGDGYIECLDMGSFPHPFSCRKFISCAKTEYGPLFGWEYTCPKGLSFDPVGGICNWSSGPTCN